MQWADSVCVCVCVCVCTYKHCMKLSIQLGGQSSDQCLLLDTSPFHPNHFPSHIIYCYFCL